MCKITYIYHSGFLAELNHACLVFDYFKGEIPPLKPEKKLYVFSSHHHPDHFNPEIFRMFPDIFTEYILAYDIKLLRRDGQPRYEGITEEQVKRAHTMRFDETLKLGGDNGITIQTVKSTDCGVAYLVFAEDKIIYHGGDLNDWYQEGESKAYNNNMTAMFRQRLARLKEILQGRSIDYAFLPLDPKQGKYYGKGMEEFLDEIEVKNAFPMHMWEKYEYIARYRGEYRHGEKVKEILK